MRTGTRRTAIAVSALSAVALAAPAFAAPGAAPTSLNLRATTNVVKAHNKANFTATLTSKGKGLVGETVHLQERTAPTTGHKTTWSNVSGPSGTAVTGAGGKASFSVSPPLASHKNSQKDQYRAVYDGNTTTTPHYAKSHSQIVTVTVKRA